jgi:hypothetical protein
MTASDGRVPSQSEVRGVSPRATAVRPRRLVGRDREVAEVDETVASGSAKARLNVTRTIRHAINELASRAPELAAHLDQSIVTGVSCCYEPADDIAWTT